MNNSATLISTAALSMLAFGPAAVAQDEGSPQFRSVEAFTCSYNEDQDRGDLDDAIEAMNEWMEERDGGGYIAWVLTPQYYNAEQDFDFVWIGASPDFRTAGQNLQNYLDEGGDVSAGFGEVATCDNHINLASLEVRSSDNEPSMTPVLTIANCRAAEGRAMSDVVAGVTAWGDTQEARGWPGSTYMWFPVFGAGETDIDFNMVGGFGSHVQLGEYMQSWFDSQTWNETRMRFAGLMNCDVARVYDARQVHDSWPE